MGTSSFRNANTVTPSDTSSFVSERFLRALTKLLMLSAPASSVVIFLINCWGSRDLSSSDAGFSFYKRNKSN
ncbi:hypothetical protein [Pedobacter steynii]